MMDRENNDNILLFKKGIVYKKHLIKKLELFLILVIVVITTFLISKSLIKVVNLSYKENSNINYLVYLKPNDYYEQPYLTNGMQYIASLIDYAEINFNYNFKMNDNIKYDYYYYIEADVKVFEKDNEANIIFEKRTNLVDNKVYKNQYNSNFTIDEDLKIDYDEYNDLVRDFKNSYNIVADSNLTLTLYIFVDGQYEGFDKEIKTNNTMNLVIPLSEQMVNIKMDYKDINDSDNIKLTSSDGMINKVFFGISIFVLALLIVSAFDLIKYILKGMKKKTPYQKRVNSILREYDRVIVEVNHDTVLSSDTDFIKVKTFEELLDASDRLEEPILYFEIKQGQRSQFIVRKNHDTYFYVLDAKDIEEDLL